MIGPYISIPESTLKRALRSPPRPVYHIVPKVLIAEEALRRAASAGSLPAEGGRRAAEETIENFRKDAKAAQARRKSLTRRAVPAAAAAAAEWACQVRGLI